MSKLDLLEFVGNTPLVELRHMSPKQRVRVFAKLEGQNPSGSVKDRIVLSMVDAAERRGDLKPGYTIVEASTGNTAIALALLSKQKGYEIKVVIPEGVVPTMGDILALYGAEVVRCEPHAGLKGAIELASQMAEKRGHYCLGQFYDSANVEAHYRTTGPEIVRALPRVDVFVAGIGTGGTIMGVGGCLRESNPNVRVVGVEPRMGERLQGLRSLEEGHIPKLLDLSCLNSRFLVSSADAVEMAHQVVRKEGIMAGVSSGATLHVALRLAQDMDEGNIVVMFSDGGWKYLPSRPWDAARKRTEGLDETHWW
jgi:cysteine synthase